MLLRRLGNCLLILLLALTFAGPAVAQESLQRIVESGLFRVGTSGSQPPFTMKARSGDLIGFEIDLAAALADAMGVELRLVEKPFGQLLDALEKGEVDAVMSGMTMTPERNMKAAFVGPYIVSGKSILTKSSTLAAIDEAEDIHNVTVVTLAGSTSEKFVKNFVTDTDLVTVDDYDEGVRMVIDGEADAMLADFPICALSVLRHPDEGLVASTEPLSIEPIGIALSPGDSLLLNLVENYLGALDAVGAIDTLETQWFQDGSWLARVP